MSECTGASVIIIVTMKHLDKLMHRNLNLKKQYLRKRAHEKTGHEKTEKREPEKENSYDRSDEIEWDENFD